MDEADDRAFEFLSFLCELFGPKVEEFGSGFEPLLIGGQAAVIYGGTRATDDFDVALRSGDNLLITEVLRQLPEQYKITKRYADDADIFGGTWQITTPGMAPMQLINMSNLGNPTRHPGHVVHFYDKKLKVGEHVIYSCLPEALIALKWFAGSPKDLDDVEEIMSAQEIDFELLEEIFKRCKRLDIFHRFVDVESKR